MTEINPGITGLEAWWELNELSGTRYDSHGSNDLTDVNTVGYNIGENCADFESANSELLYISDNTNLSFSDEDFSFVVFIKMESLPSISNIIGKSDSSTDNREYRLYYYSTPNRFEFIISTLGTAPSTVVLDANIFGAPSANNWYCIICRQNAANNKMYISVNNGSSDEKSINGGCFNGNSPFMLGAWGTIAGPGSYYDGLIKKVSVWRKFLSADEMTYLYNSGNGRTYLDIIGSGGEPVSVSPFFNFFKTFENPWNGGLWQPKNKGLVTI
jgi:hypothetical protein